MKKLKCPVDSWPAESQRIFKYVTSTEKKNNKSHQNWKVTSWWMVCRMLNQFSTLTFSICFLHCLRFYTLKNSNRVHPPSLCKENGQRLLKTAAVILGLRHDPNKFSIPDVFCKLWNIHCMILAGDCIQSKLERFDLMLHFHFNIRKTLQKMP